MPPNQQGLIVGANRGIGLGVTKEFLMHGWDLIVTARLPEKATALQELSAAHPGRLSIARLDMADAADIDAFASTLGGKMLDAVLVNAGIAGPGHMSASAVTVEEIGELMFVNAIAPVRLARSLKDHVREGTGVVAFTSSIMGSVALNEGGHELYRASKAALNSLSRGLWTELKGRSLTLLSLHPGWVRTDMGGPDAAVSVEHSAAGIVAVMEAAKRAHEHRFVEYTGKEVPW